MKKILCMIVCGFILCGLCGCNDYGEKHTGVSTTDVETEIDKSQVPEGESDTDDNEENAPDKKQEEDEEKEKDDAPVRDGNLLDSMSQAQRNELNLFLSNFSEAQYGIGEDACDAADMIGFAFVHNCINNSDFKIVCVDDKYSIPASLVDSTLNRFFGKTVPHESPDDEWWDFEDGNFVCPASDGESRAYFTTATHMTDKGDDIYEVDFSVFFNANDPHEDMDPSWYEMTEREAKQYFEFCYSGKATLESKDGLYVLVSYMTN